MKYKIKYKCKRKNAKTHTVAKFGCVVWFDTLVAAKEEAQRIYAFKRHTVWIENSKHKVIYVI